MEADREASGEAHVQQQQQQQQQQQDVEGNPQQFAQQMSLWQAFKDECHLENFGLKFYRDDVFYRAQWEWPCVIFLCYRVFLAVYTAIWMVVSIGDAPVLFGHPWPAFLTNWSYTLLVVHLWLSAIISLFWTSRLPFLARPAPFSDPPPRSAPMSQGNARTYGTSNDDTAPVVPDVTVQTPDRLPVIFRASWAVFASIANIVFIITFIYFAFLFPRIYPPGVKPRAVDVNLHGINSVIIVIEMCVSAFPVRILHAIYPVLYGLCYIIFSVIYWAADPENNVIYKGILDWNIPGRTIAIIIGLIVVVQILQIILWLIYRLRLWLYGKIYANYVGYV